MAKQRCTICAKPIGYERRFYSDGPYGYLVHADCLEDEVPHAVA